MQNCLFCQISNKKVPTRIVWENEKTMAFLSIEPVENGHTVVIPKKHSVDFVTADLETVIAVVEAKKAVAQLLQETLKVNNFNFISNNGAEAFQEVFHYHEHIIPKFAKNLGFTPRKTEHPKDDLDNVYERIIKKKHP